MKLATMKNGSRDGRLVVVNRAGTHYIEAPVATLQGALDDWNAVEGELLECSARVNADGGSPLDFASLMAPLPRAYEWIDGSAYLNHVRLVRKARNAAPPKTLETDPLVYQGGSGVLLGPRDPVKLGDPSWGLDFEGEVCPDELGDAWQGGRLHLPLNVFLNGEQVGLAEAGPEMHFSFHQLIAHVTRTRALTAGTILGSGTVSNEDRSKGISCLAERRMIEIIDEGEAKTSFMKVGDQVKVEMFGPDGVSLFGSIEQRVIAR